MSRGPISRVFEGCFIQGRLTVLDFGKLVFIGYLEGFCVLRNFGDSRPVEGFFTTREDTVKRVIVRSRDRVEVMIVASRTTRR